MSNALVKRVLQPILKLGANIIILSSLLLSGLPAGAAYAAAPRTGAKSLPKAPLMAPDVGVSLSIYPSEHTMIGEDFDFYVSFQNPGPDVGYGPFIDLIFPNNGMDGANGTDTPDGINFVGATFKGNALTATTLTFPTPVSPATLGCVNHPFALDNTGAPLQVCGNTGDTLVVLELPFSSVTPAMPMLYADITAHISDLADLNQPLTIKGRGGFRYGGDSLDNPIDDPVIINPSSIDGSGWPSLDITPHVIEISKSYDGPAECPYLSPDEQVFDPSLCPYGDVNPVYESVTGPNFARNYTISIHVATLVATHPITGLVVTDYIPNNIVVKSSPAISITGGGVLGTPAPTYDAPANNNQVVVNFASLTADASITIPFYIPQSDANSAPVLDPITGDSVKIDNVASALGNWIPIDPRDTTTSGDAIANGPCSSPIPNPPTCNVLHEINARSIAVQKSVAIATENGPTGYSAGDTLKYTLDFQISDYFSYGDLLLTDQMTDGQTLDLTTPPTLTVTDHNRPGGLSGSFPLANYTATPINLPGPGSTNYTTELKFSISAAMATLNAGDNGVLQGGEAGTTGGIGATGQIVYYAKINESFTDTYAGKDSFVDHGDVFYNVATLEGSVRDNTTPTTVLSGTNQTDESVQKFEIVHGGLEKQVYAINGAPVAPSPATPYSIQPGDTITFELKQDMPSSDSEHYTITDFVPLPILRVSELSTSFDSTMSAAAPAAGMAKFGPNDTRGVTPIITLDSTGNSITFDFGGFNDPADASTTIDVLFTLTMNHEPYADNVTLTNLASGVEQTTNNEDFDYIGADQFVIHEPAVNVSKGVVATSNMAAVFTPTTVGPVTFAAPGSNPSWSGLISSGGLAANPVDSDITNVNSGDVLTFAIVLNNIGNDTAGAFDILVRDVMPAELQVPAGGLNLQVRNGDGTATSFTTVGTGLFDAAGGIHVANMPAYSASSGANVIVITYDLQLATGLASSTQIVNTANLVNYSSTASGPNYVGNTPTATVNSDTATATLPDAAPVITEGSSVNVSSSENNSPTSFALQLHATDANGDPLTWSIRTQATFGTASIGASTGVAAYVPLLNYSGTDSFVAQVSDGTLTDAITVHLNIKSVLQPSELNWNQSYGIQYDGWVGFENPNARLSTLDLGYDIPSSGPIPRGARKARSGTFSIKVTYKYTGLTWFSYRGPDQGKAQVIVDGALKTTVDLYSATPQWQYPVQIRGLANSTHTVIIKPMNARNPASSDNWVVVDGFKIGNNSYDDNFVQVSLTCSYTSWLGISSPSARFSSYRVSSTQGATMKFSFLGRNFNWVTARGPSYGKAVIYVDGVAVKTVDLYNASQQWQYRIMISNLSYGTHVIQIKVLHTKNPRSSGFGIVADGFEID